MKHEIVKSLSHTHTHTHTHTHSVCHNFHKRANPCQEKGFIS